MRKLLDLAPLNSYLLDTMGWILFKQGRLNEAEGLLDRASRISPRNAGIRFHLGSLLLSKGKKKEAVTLWRAALELNPSWKLRRQILRAIRQLNL